MLRSIHPMEVYIFFIEHLYDGKMIVEIFLYHLDFHFIYQSQILYILHAS
uniref:Uncharacterized protein n=1 Tax=Rhizophagus irregularis (strain DAOM 181602 / DAOM 197198 / MUCL 43194) TaxID=747089 RepID=U9SXZ7_RHIID